MLEPQKLLCLLNAWKNNRKKWNAVITYCVIIALVQGEIGAEYLHLSHALAIY